MADSFIYGFHAVHAAVANKKRRIKTLFINQERHDARSKELLREAEERKITIKRLSLETLNREFPNISHQGVVAVVEAMPECSESDLPLLIAQSKNPLILLLDGVTDPHNLGACLRSADAAGVDFIVIPKDNSAPLSSTVQKVASGAAESVPLVRVTNLVRAMQCLKEHGVWIYGAAGEAEAPIYALDGKGPIAIVMGAEGDGLRRLTRERCDGLFYLPMLGTVESLNVSVATGISLYEIVRQRLS